MLVESLDSNGRIVDPSLAVDPRRVGVLAGKAIFGVPWGTLELHEACKAVVDAQ